MADEDCLARARDCTTDSRCLRPGSPRFEKNEGLTTNRPCYRYGDKCLDYQVMPNMSLLTDRR
jgi:hypothetical protein